MDFEEQLEKAEKLSSPSLVGSSLRSADDSEHNNYIHPEKYKGSSKKSPSKKKNSILNSTLGASLDDLMSEGALLGSEEDFDSYLDESGNVKAERVSYTEEKKSHPLSKETPESAPEAKIGSPSIAAEGAEKEDEEEEEEPEIDATPKPKKKDVSESSSASATAASGAGSIYQNEDYSTPNLSEYQLENQITDHKDLLSSVQSNDPHRLPTRLDYLKSEATAERPKVKKTASFSTPSLIAEDYDSDVSLPVKDGIHAPYFQTDRDGRSSSRSRVAERSSDRSRSRSRSAARPHLARGDSYKSTHDSDPSSYELPSKLDEEEPIKEEEEEEAVKQEEEEGDRRSRMSKPTMGDSLAAIENQERDSSSTARRSLVTTGDYTNFDVDAPESQQQGNDNFTTRSLSSTNYLRSISRSRSRQPGDKGTKPARSHSLLNEKNDSNTDELSSEGALLNDDGYSRINGLDAMVEEVLHLKDGEKKLQLKKLAKKKLQLKNSTKKKLQLKS